jgi:hypothetical protein
MLVKRRRKSVEHSAEYKLVRELEIGMHNKCLSLGNSLPSRLAKKVNEFTLDDKIIE